MIKNSSKKVIGIIPARYDSTRFPGKPLVSIMGKPLIQRTWENAKKCTAFDDLIIATDDARIKDVAEAFGAKVVMTSPDHHTGTDRLAEVAKDIPAHIVVNIQGDEPCLETKVMESVVEALQSDAGSVMSTAAIPITSEEMARNPSVVKCVLDKSGHALYFSRGLIPHTRDQKYHKEIQYYHHLGIYGFRKEFLLHYNKLEKTPLQMIEDLEQLKVLEHGYRIKVAIVNSKSIGVDTPEDIKKVEELLCNENTSS